MNTEEPVYFSTSGKVSKRVTVNDCGNVGDPSLVQVDFGGFRIYTRNAQQLLENLRTATLELAQLMAKHRDNERASK